MVDELDIEAVFAADGFDTAVVVYVEDSKPAAPVVDIAIVALLFVGLAVASVVDFGGSGLAVVDIGNFGPVLGFENSFELYLRM